METRSQSIFLAVWYVLAAAVNYARIFDRIEASTPLGYVGTGPGSIKNQFIWGMYVINWWGNA